ncbi:mechanosensitive ion channel family protein [Bacteroidales bacterium OttesenSCG-928-L03]|nr:mechanosensitive ion channel family protein [Bacteroidales bacterium OttesenSCG-928-L03]
MNTTIESLAQKISNWSHDLLSGWGISGEAASWINMAFLFILATVIIYGTLYLTKYLITVLFNKLTHITKFPFFGFLNKNRFPILVARLLPYAIIKGLLPIVFFDFPVLLKLAEKGVEIWLVFLIIHIIVSLIRSSCDLLALRPAYKDKPMTSYIQVVQILLYIIGAVMVFSILTGKSPAVFFGAMGAASAIMMLVFQDSIKGFVASIQVTSNDLVRLGDWITVPKYGADGDVVEINLTTVKVRNFDKTISTLPTYSLISDSFQNWRGMVDARGRRIKRALYIKQSSIRFITDDELPRFEKIQGIASFIQERNEEIAEHNRKIGADRSVLVNGRNLTNGGLFRVYTEWYLKNHPGMKPDYTMMVRQLNPTPNGIPFEIYAFTNTTNWVEYESIMSDIFDHLIATVKYFDLQLFEYEAGGDVKALEMLGK